jgi:hypothetical protein
MFAFTVWSSLAQPAPLFALSLAVEGKGRLDALAHPSWKLIVSVLAAAPIEEVSRLARDAPRPHRYKGLQMGS